MVHKERKDKEACGGRRAEAASLKTISKHWRKEILRGGHSIEMYHSLEAFHLSMIKHAPCNPHFFVVWLRILFLSSSLILMKMLLIKD